MPFVVGEEYENRHGKYVVLAIHRDRMTVRYMNGSKEGTTQDLDVTLQERIVHNLPIRREQERLQEQSQFSTLPPLYWCWACGDNISKDTSITCECGWIQCHCGACQCPDYSDGSLDKQPECQAQIARLGRRHYDGLVLARRARRQQ